MRPILDRTPNLESESTMQRLRVALLVSVIVVVAGLALGAGKSETDTSIANAASKILLTLGAVSFIAALIVIAIRRRRTRHIRA